MRIDPVAYLIGAYDPGWHKESFYSSETTVAKTKTAELLLFPFLFLNQRNHFHSLTKSLRTSSRQLTN